MKALPHLRRAVAVVLFVVPILFSACGKDSPTSSNPTWHWSALGDGLPGEVRAVEEYGGKLYAGGYFGTSTSDGIRVFNSRQWAAVYDAMSGGSVNGPVYDLITYNNRLIATGSLQSTDQLTLNGVAAWDGSSWSTLGSGLPGDMAGSRMAVYNGQLIVGSMYSLGALYVMSWNGSSWTPIKSGGLGIVLDMCVYNGVLVVVADSIVDHGTYIQSYPWVRSWNGSSWTSMSSGAGSPRALAIVNDTLYLGGEHAPYLKAWTGSTWETRSSATFEDDEHIAVIYRMTCHDGKLVLGGDFDRIDGQTCANMATWDGASFGSITTGLSGVYDPRVHLLECVGERLIVGGSFTHAGSVEAANIAEWSFH